LGFLCTSFSTTPINNNSVRLLTYKQEGMRLHFTSDNASFFFIYLLGFICYTWCAEFEKSPRVITHKSVIAGSAQIRVDRPWTINYFFVNTGDANAIDVTIMDMYDPKVFQGVENVNSQGHVSYTEPILEVQKSFSFNVTVIPKVTGTYQTSRARVKYFNGGVLLEEDEEYDDEDLLTGHSSSLGPVQFLSTEEYLNSNHSIGAVKWAFFLLMTSASVLAPGLVYLQASR